MTPQQIFDTVVRHLLEQGEPCIDASGKCRYRYNGKMCAIGVLIPDDVYNTNMEHHPVRQLVEGEWQSSLPAFFRDNLDLLRSLQQTHDHWERDGTIEVWKRKMVYLAACCNIDASVLDEELVS
jgi:hypothetical protein